MNLELSKRFIYFVPPLLFAIVAGAFLWGLDPDRDPREVARRSLVSAMLPWEITRPAPWDSSRLGLLSVGEPESTHLADLIGMDLIGFGAPVAGGPDHAIDPTSKPGPAKQALSADMPVAPAAIGTVHPRDMKVPLNLRNL